MANRPSTYLPELEPAEWSTDPALRVLSLGGGVQPTAIALMAEQGIFGIRPDAAIFADTKAEPAHVYTNISWIKERVSFPVYVVDRGRSLYQDVWAGTNHDGNIHLSIPAFIQRSDGKRGMLNRQCTSVYKVRVIRRKVGELLAERMGQSKPPNCVEQWLGISTDEWTRQRDSDVRYIYNYYPLETPAKGGHELRREPREHQRTSGTEVIQRQELRRKERAMVAEMSVITQLSESEQALILAAKRLHCGGKPRYTGFELATEVRDYRDDRRLMAVGILGSSLDSLAHQGHLAVVLAGTRGYNPHIKHYRLIRVVKHYGRRHD